MTTTDLLGTFRAEVYDTVLPYLWSDALILTYIDDAQKQFCRLTYGIEDSRSFSLTVPGDSLTEWFALDPTILKIRNAVDKATGLDVPFLPVEKMADFGLKFDGAVGKLQVLITGMDKGFVRAHPVPNVAMTVNLRVFRLPADVGSGDDFEIDAQHLLPLLMWVKYKAYSIQDAETRDDKKAALNKAGFEAYCAASKLEQSRMRHSAGAVSYGGLPAGVAGMRNNNQYRRSY